MSFIRRSAVLIALIVSCSAAPLLVRADTILGTGWKGKGTDNNWTTANNWDSNPPTTTASNERNLFFGQGYFNAGNNGFTTSNNNLSGWAGYRINFQDISGQPDVSFTVTGNGFTLFDFGGSFPKIENLSNVTQTFSLSSGQTITLQGGGAGKAEINPVNGDLVFSAGTRVALNSPLDIFGNNGRTLTFNDVVSGGSGNPITLQQNSTLELNAANTYTGNTNIKAGTVLLGANAPSGSAGALGNSTNAVTLGDTSGTANASLLTNGAFTVGRAVTVQSGNAGTITIGGNTAAASTYSGNINLGTASGTAKSVTLAAATGGSVDFSGVINENTSVPASNVTIGSATHTGTVKLSNTGNGYGGVTTVNGAVLEVTEVDSGGSNSSIGNSSGAASNLVLSGGTLRYVGGGVSSTNRLFTFDANGATLDANAAVSFTGAGSLVASGTGNRTLSLIGSNNGSLASVIVNPSVGATAVTKNGSGTWTLSGTNAYTGDTNISGGILRGNTIANSGANSAFGAGSGFSISNGARLDYTGSTASTNRTISLGSGGGTIAVSSLPATLTVSGVISGPGGLTKTSNGTLVLSGSNSYSGDTNFAQGTLSGDTIADSGVNSAFGAGSGFSFSGFGTLEYTGGSASTNRPLVLNFGLGARVDVTNSGTTLVANGTVSGAGDFTKLGAGRLTLTNTNSYSGITNIYGGTLSGVTIADTGSNSAFGAGSGFILSDATLEYTGGSASTNRTIQLGGSIGSTVVVTSPLTTLTVSGNVSGPQPLTKSGAGTLVLNAANTYGGGTTISAGTLQANNTSGSATGTGTVTVANGGTLAGTGAISGAVTVNGGGTLAPGNSIESLDVGAITFSADGNGGSTFAVEMNTNVALSLAADLLNANGNLSIAAGATLSLVDAGNTVLPGGTKFTLISYAGTWDNGIFLGRPDDSLVSVGVNTYVINYNDTLAGANFGGGSFGNYLTLTAVPEASALLFGGLACVIFGLAYGARVLRRRAVAVDGPSLANSSI